MNKEEIVKLIAGRIENEMRKHPTLEWQMIAASKIYSQWFEFLNNENQELQAKVRELEELINTKN